MLLLIIFVVFFWGAASASAQESQVKEANNAFKKQMWDEAIDGYMNALEQSKKHTDIIHYDLGAAFYKKGNYDQSIEHLQKTITDKNKDLSAASYYNLGNAFYRKGQSLEKTNIDDAIGSLQKSVESYTQALNLNSKDKDTKYNQEFAERELERLKKKKERQEQQEKQSKPDKNNSQNEQNNQKNESQSSDSRDQQKQESDDRKQNQQTKSGNEQNQQSKPHNEQQNASQGQSQSLEQKQAQRMLEDYERQEAPKGLLNFSERHQGERHVDKDW